MYKHTSILYINPISHIEEQRWNQDIWTLYISNQLVCSAVRIERASILCLTAPVSGIEGFYTEA